MSFTAIHFFKKVKYLAYVSITPYPGTYSMLGTVVLGIISRIIEVSDDSVDRMLLLSSSVHMGEKGEVRQLAQGLRPTAPRLRDPNSGPPAPR